MRTSFNRRRKAPLGFIALAGGVVLAVGVAALFREPLGGLLWRAAAPVLQLRNTLGASEAEQLRAELAGAQARAADRDMLYAENVDLKRRLGRAAEGSRVLAGVLQRPPGVPYDTFVLDAGSEQGLAVGQLVSAGGASLIGRVVEVHAQTARVVLFSSPGESHDALLRGEVPVAVAGQGGGSFVAEVPAGTQVLVGDSILFPGIAPGYSGTVSFVERRSGESFVTLYLHLPFDPFALRFVEVLL